MMTKRLILLILASGLLISGTGCGLLRCLLCPGATCDPQHCAPMPGPVCGPPAVAACEPACVPPCQPACGPVSGAPCALPDGPAQAPCGPLTWLFGLFEGDCWYDGGCGEVYRGDWCGDPPDCCDPCDQWGNFTGGGARGYSGGYASGTARQPAGVAPAPEVARLPRSNRR